MRVQSLGAYKGGKVVGVVSAIPKSIAAAEVGIVCNQFRELDLVEPLVRLVPIANLKG